VGVSWAGGHYAVTGAPKVGDVVSQAPQLESAWGILAWPLTTALAYGVLSAWNGRDDPRRRLRQRPERPPPTHGTPRGPAGAPPRPTEAQGTVTAPSHNHPDSRTFAGT